jgi:hypothetical protein
MSPNATGPRLRDEFDRPDTDIMPDLPESEAEFPQSGETERAARKKGPARSDEAKAKPVKHDLPAPNEEEEEEADNPELGAEIERELARPKARKPSIFGTLILLILIAVVGVATGFALVMLL